MFVAGQTGDAKLKTGGAFVPPAPM